MTKAPRKKREPKDQNEEKKRLMLNEKMKEDNGIGYAEKVMSYLDDQAKTEALQSEEGAHVSRGRKKHRVKGDSRTASETGKVKSSEERKRSREYSKPEDIKLSPVVKRDLFTGEIISDSQSLALFNKSIPVSRPAPTVTTEPPPPSLDTNGLSLTNRVNQQHTQGMAPSPGKSFLDATTGQEVFGTSIEEDNPMLAKKPEIITNGHTPMNYNFDTYDTAKISTTAGGSSRKKVEVQQQQNNREEAADKGIPTRLKPDKLLANEEFYEQLRTSMKEVEAIREFESTQEDPETYTRYSHHLGRAEFGTLKKRTSTRPSAATSRDPSGDRSNAQKSLGVSRDTSGDRLALAGKHQSLNGSRDLYGRSDSRMSGASASGLPDLEFDDTVPDARDQSGDRGVQRTTSLLVSGVDMDKPSDCQPDLDILAKREGVLKEIEDKKNQIREAKAWIQNGLMTVVGVGVMAYLQTLESIGS